jgi:hypothetical protein
MIFDLLLTLCVLAGLANLAILITYQFWYLLPKETHHAHSHRHAGR